MSNSVKLNGYSSASEAGSRRRMAETQNDGRCLTQEEDVGEVTTKNSTINPFIHRIPLSTFDKIKVGSMWLRRFAVVYIEEIQSMHILCLHSLTLTSNNQRIQARACIPMYNM